MGKVAKKKTGSGDRDRTLGKTRFPVLVWTPLLKGTEDMNHKMRPALNRCVFSQKLLHL